MGFELLAGYQAPFNPNLNPAPVLRAYPGLTDGLLGAYQFDLSPTPQVPVAGSYDDPGVWGGDPAQEPLGFRFDNNDVLNTGIVPGSDIAGFTMYFIGRKTGAQPEGAVEVGSLGGVGAVESELYRLDIADYVAYFNTAVQSYQAAALYDDASRWDFWACSISGAGAKLYRPRVNPAPATTTVTIAELGAAQLNNPFRIGTTGTAIRWSETAIMAGGIFGRQLSDAEVLDQYEAYQAYAAEKGVIL
jgi:hypothetical protein